MLAARDSTLAFPTPVLRCPFGGQCTVRMSRLAVDRDTGLGVIAFGPAGGEAGSLWCLVLGNHRLTVWAYGMCDGTLVASLHTLDDPELVELTSAVAPVTRKPGELRASGLRPAQVLALIELVQSYLESRSLQHV